MAFSGLKTPPAGLAKLKETLAEAAPAREERASKVGLVAVDVSKKTKVRGFRAEKTLRGQEELRF